MPINSNRFGRRPNPWDSPQELRFKRTAATFRLKRALIDGVFVALMAVLACALVCICWVPSN